VTIDPGFGLALLIALVSAVLWLARLEGLIKRAGERHDDLSKHFWRLHNRIDAGKVYVFRRSPAEEGSNDDDQ